ncbi:serC [Symbiodinium natans]|uniref:phosphoserine transaminase n=1 Tax=Symbiodinium natans TaxID=878477 RepID=A0A812UGS0_9DINO|nr:serC [Symbiodinium natans]
MADGRVYNFSAGPSAMPLEVLEEVQREMVNYKGSGMSVMEMSHRSKEFMAIAAEAEKNLRDIFAVPSDYKVLMLQGGATLQFSSVVLNMLGTKSKADYLVTGQWGEKAHKECNKYGTGQLACNTKSSKFTTIPAKAEWKLDPEAAFVHYCANETVNGVEFSYTPDVGSVPLVADMSSNFCSKPIEVGKHAYIYAGIQKNLGPAGMAVGFLRPDFADGSKEMKICPTYCSFKTTGDNGSMYNTPACFTLYVMGEYLKYTKKVGGLSYWAEQSDKKSGLLYGTIDGSDGFYQCPVEKSARSRMNVPFTIKGGDEALEKKFLDEAKKHKLYTLAGHRSVGGCRASLYNGMPLEGVAALTDFMKSFMDENRKCVPAARGRPRHPPLLCDEVKSPRMVILSEKVLEAFRSWDVQGRGTISRKQLIRILQRLTPQVTESDLEVLFVAAGADSGGGVKYNDFISYLWADGSAEDAKEEARARGLWEDALRSAREKAAEAKTWPADKVDRYWNEVETRLWSKDYFDHVKTNMFVQADQDKDGRVSFDEAKALICKSLRCAADLTKAPQPTQEEVRQAFDAHDTLVEGRGRMGVGEFVNLARYLQVIVAEAMLPFSKVGLVAGQGNFKAKHSALQALLKRIQRDRGEQIRHRQLDSQRLIQRNKNLKADLYKKQHLEFQRAEAAIRSIMSQPEHAQRLLDEHDPASVARSAAMGELPALGRIKWKGPCLPENYMPPGGISKGLVKSKTTPRDERQTMQTSAGAASDTA